MNNEIDYIVFTLLAASPIKSAISSDIISFPFSSIITTFQKQEKKN